MFAMSGDGTDDVDIPIVFLFSQDAWQLLQALAHDPAMLVTLGDAQTGIPYLYINKNHDVNHFFIFLVFVRLSLSQDNTT